MTVAELIEELSKFPGHHPVLCSPENVRGETMSILEIESQVVREESGPIVVLFAGR